jgi:hypothetical protein
MSKLAPVSLSIDNNELLLSDDDFVGIGRQFHVPPHIVACIIVAAIKRTDDWRRCNVIPFPRKPRKRQPDLFDSGAA